MKKFIRFICLVMILAMLPVQVLAKGEQHQPEIIRFDDGSYITVQLVHTDSRSANTRTGSKIYTYRNSAGEELWEAVLRGSFTYDGSTSSCTSSSCTVTITNTSWYTISKVASKSGNTARVDLKMGRRLSGITIQEKVFVITLSCDANGNLS